MFRNPRENATRASEDPLKPSTGRPPSPSAPGIEHLPRQPANVAVTNAGMSVPSPLKPATDGRSNSPNSKATPLAARNGRPKIKSNTSILSFFKKAEPGSEASRSGEGTLFIQDGDTSRGIEVGPADGDIYGLDENMNESNGFHDVYIENGGDRYNETAEPVKRRKVSPPRNILGRVGEQQVATADISVQDNFRPQDISNMEVPPLDPDAASIGRYEPPCIQTTKQKGPFLEDSDSEDDLRDNEVEVDVDALDAEINATIQVKEDEAVQEAQSREATGIAVPTPDDPPTLKKEESTYAEVDGFADFEGMEDFDDEYDEGEEFSERRWQLEQARLEEAEGLGNGLVEDTFEISTGFVDDDKSLKSEETMEGNGSSPSCPVCNASLLGVSDQDASVHVNHCLDGNPTPLPTPTTVDGSKPPKAESEGLPAQRFKRVEGPAKPPQENPTSLGTPKGASSSAFSKLMSGHAEDAAWATAAASENASRGKPAYQRTCPFYKILPGLFICVDAFRYGAVQGCNAYFLSHFHSDHYIGLTATWSNGPIYCSRPTANLVKQQLRVDPKWVIPLEFEKTVEVPNTEGVRVTMIPANHCPGSSLYLFEKETASGSRNNGRSNGNNPKRTQRVLHCGDFRACPAHTEHPLLKPDVLDAVTGKTQQQKIDVCYLDTTYMNPKYAFPSQEDVIKACADMCVSMNKPSVNSDDNWERAKQERAGGNMVKFVRKADTNNEGDHGDEDETNNASENATDRNSKSKNSSRGRNRLLVVVGTYSIGKERICLGIARALNTKIFAPPAKQRICAALEDAELNSMLTTDPRAAQVHMTPLFEIRAETLTEYLNEYGDRFSKAVGFRPTGWNYRPPGSRFTDSPAVSTVLYGGNWKSPFGLKDLVPQRGSNDKAMCFGVPYSEHSSFRELTMFCCGLRIEKVIPTVNVGSAKSRERMKAWIERWNVERRKNGLFRLGDGEGEGQWYPGKGTWELRTTL